MRGTLKRFVQEVRASFWFIPSVMSVAAVLLASATVALDQRGSAEWLGGIGFVYLNQPEGARSLLSTIAGSLINVAGVVFSLTMVTLTLASQQFGPRLLGNFMRDRGNQLVLGAFVSTFIYCLLVLRTVRGEGDAVDPFVPHLSVAVAMLITLVTLGALIYFIHHVASSIQVQNVIAKVVRSLRQHVAADGDRKLFPATVGQPAAADVSRAPAGPGRLVATEDAGYLQAVDGEALLRLARENDAVITLLVRPGEFVMHGSPVVGFHPDADDEAVRRALGALAFGPGRGGSEDLEATLDQLLELALRALSPAMNDPITATSCLDQVCDALLELGRRDLPSRFRADEDGALRLVVPELDIGTVARRQFSSMRSALAGSLLAASHALSRIDAVLGATENRRLAEVLEVERAALLAACRDSMSPSDQASLQRFAG